MTMNKPDASKVSSKSYITYRRLWLDALLEAFSSEMEGTVIDLGGKRLNKRGAFQPPEKDVKSWWYVNLDRTIRPNIAADVTILPLRNDLADTVICTEVLEHVADPAACIREIYRILKPGGAAIVSIPFLYPVHADPFDFQRYTAEGLRLLFSRFSTVQILDMGGYFGTLGMFIELGIPEIKGTAIHARAFRWSFKHIGRLLCRYELLQNKSPGLNNRFTTGYFVVAKK